LDRELIRSRFLINMHPYPARSVPAMSFIARVGPTQPFADSILNDAERLELHRQLRDFSLQYLRNIP
ncbi:MAG TPA: hypothetical protein DCW60_01520, partial [Sutterella sp.]|nr:hypothetical protein [Sutterella sp.]